MFNYTVLYGFSATNVACTSVRRYYYYYYCVIIREYLHRSKNINYTHKVKALKTTRYRSRLLRLLEMKTK